MSDPLKYQASDVRDEREIRRFTRNLIQDVRALEYMLEHGMFETGVRRIGAEQELFLVDDRHQPAPVVEQILERSTDPRLVTELTRFNLEFNTYPLEFGGDCLRRLERQIDELVTLSRSLAEEVGVNVVMAGILPTIHLSDLVLENMTPKPRYYALNDAIARLRGGPGAFNIRGVDELFVKHDSIMLEGCNTSFQTHFQVAPDEFAGLYNVAQVIAAPVLAAATNSPLLFGKRLWRETRIALFQQAVDTRNSNLYLREMSPRVHFGNDWIRDSVTEIFKEDIARFRVLITCDAPERPLEMLERGEIPPLPALQLHNGTVYRWNRACYGIGNGVPHLRIENRILPAGPSPVDEIANAAFWFGLASGIANKGIDVTQYITFDEAKSNFLAAARHGLASQLTWLDKQRYPAHELIAEELLPLARQGLRDRGIDEEDVTRYLGVIRDRVATKRTGSQWQLESIESMKGQGTRAERLASLVRAMLENQATGRPCHEWPLGTFARPAGAGRVHSSRVEHFMATDLFTVNQEELIEFVACIMDWRKIRHVLVEDTDHRLVGLVTHRMLLRYLAERPPDEDPYGTPVKDVMRRDPISVSPETPTREAIALMRKHRIGSLPVVRDGQLVGIVTETEFMDIAGQLLEDGVA
ncbi:MAG TPA: glutamate-cysteine ligase family protein [Rhodothermales bacterium]